jgi:Icc-related predicted phosphoesterase
MVNNTVITIDDVNFICTTLWSQLPPQHEYIVKRCLADFRLIGKMNPPMFNNLNKHSVTFLRTKLKELEGQKNVVVSHHLPTWKVVSDPYKSDPVTYGFCNEHLDNLLYPSNMKAWIHGHSHDARHDDINGVQVVRNPFGYMHEQGNGYQNNKVITV